MSYTIYQCTTCNLKKSEKTDNIRVQTLGCTITKGCLGRLIKLSEQSTPICSSGLTWNPRTEVSQTSNSIQPQNIPITINSSNTGAVVCGVNMSLQNAIDYNTLKFRFEEKIVREVPFIQFRFKLTIPSSVISGRDSQGKILRVNTLLIEAHRVVVKVNGNEKKVDIDYVVNIQDRIDFLSPIPAGAIVDILVYEQAQTQFQTLTFNVNIFQQNTLAAGAWGNVKSINKNGVIYYLFTCPQLGTIDPSSVLKLNSIWNEEETVCLFNGTLGSLNDIIVLLADEPFGNLDRRQDLFIDGSFLEQGFNLTARRDKIIKLEATNVSEIWPLFKIEEYLEDDKISVQSALDANSISNSFIIGPQ